MVVKNTIAAAHTDGVPPASGRMKRANIGCRTNTSDALSPIVTEYRTTIARADRLLIAGS